MPPGKSAEINLADYIIEANADTEEILDSLPQDPGLVHYFGDSTDPDQDKGLNACMELNFDVQWSHDEQFRVAADANVEMVLMAETKSSVARQLNIELGKALQNRGRPEKVETILTVESCPGIIDTGASKTVIGQKKIDALIRSLPSTIRAKLHWGKSATTFRFGNDGTLASLGALYVPLGSRWMRIEVVSGGTPFLLSNAFLKSLAADVCTSTSELRVAGSRQRIPLKVNSKGLFQVELSHVLDVISREALNSRDAGEVVTHVSDEVGHEHDRHVGHASQAVDEAKVVQEKSLQHTTSPFQSNAERSEGCQAGTFLSQQSDYSAIPRESEASRAGDHRPGSDHQVPRSGNVTRLGGDGDSRGSPQGEEVRNSPDYGAEVLSVDPGTSPPHEFLGTVSSAVPSSDGALRDAGYPDHDVRTPDQMPVVPAAKSASPVGESVELLQGYHVVPKSSTPAKRAVEAEVKPMSVEIPPERVAQLEAQVAVLQRELDSARQAIWDREQ